MSAASARPEDYRPDTKDPAVWGGMPMPPAVAALPTTGSGMPVVYITQYLPADRAAPDPEYPDFDAPGGLAIGCACEFGHGRPQIGKQCPHRQRQAMVQRLCNVCGNQVDQAIFAGVTDLALPDLPDGLVSIEAPTHPACLAYSALTCPHMSSHLHEYRIATTGSYGLWDRWMITGGEHSFQPHDTPRPQILPGMWLGALDLHLALLRRSDATVVGLDEWMRMIAPQPYRGLWATR